MLDLADHPGFAEQHRRGAGGEGVGVVRHLRIVDLLLLHGIDVELQGVAAGVVVDSCCATCRSASCSITEPPAASST